MTQPGAPGPRYNPGTEPVPIRDENLGSNERGITLSWPNLCVLFPDDATSEYEAIPIAEVTQVGEEAFALREEFVPPCLAVGASFWLMKRLALLHDILIQTSNDLSASRRARGELADFAAGDWVAFGKLRAVNAAIPLFRHMIEHKHAHPEQVYLALAGLAGDLCTLSSRDRPVALPVYDHQAFGVAFGELDGMLRDLLRPGEVPGFRCPLEAKGHSIQAATLEAKHVEPGVALFMGARADVDQHQLLAELPRRVAIGSLDQIEIIVDRALRGVPIRHAPDPPGRLPRSPGFAYFELEPSGPYWDAIRRNKTLAIHAPPDIPGLVLELVGVQVGS